MEQVTNDLGHSPDLQGGNHVPYGHTPEFTGLATGIVGAGAILTGGRLPKGPFLTTTCPQGWARTWRSCPP